MRILDKIRGRKNSAAVEPAEQVVERTPAAAGQPNVQKNNHEQRYAFFNKCSRIVLEQQLPSNFVGLWQKTVVRGNISAFHNNGGDPTIIVCALSTLGDEAAVIHIDTSGVVRPGDNDSSDIILTIDCSAMPIVERKLVANYCQQLENSNQQLTTIVDGVTTPTGDYDCILTLLGATTK